jgi:hypothetical protein
MQLDAKKKQQVKIEYRFWKEGLNKVLNGFRETEFDEALIKFLDELDFASMSELDKKLIFSQALIQNSSSKKA